MAAFYPEGEDVLKDDNYAFFVHLLYPKEIPYSRDKLVRRLYQEVREGKRPRFPKKYFDGYEGRKKAAVCLNYLMQQELPGHFHEIREMYEYFASKEGYDLIVDNALALPLKTIFKTPILFFHESLPPDERDPLWFHYAEFEYLFKANLDDEALKKLKQYKKTQEQKQEVWNRYQTMEKGRSVSLTVLGRRNEPVMFEQLLTKVINLKKPGWVKGIDNMYRWFLSEDGDEFLKNYGFSRLFKTYYPMKEDYLHAMLEDQEGNDFLYHYYKFQSILNKEDEREGDTAEEPVKIKKTKVLEETMDEEKIEIPSFVAKPDYINGELID